MSKGGTQAPASPNLGALVQGQTTGNLEAAAEQAGLNNVNTNSPFGSSTYNMYGTGQEGIGPQGYVLSQTLNQPLQNLFNTQANLAETLSGGANNVANLAVGPALGGANTTISGLTLAQNLAPTGGLDFSGAPAMPTNINFSGLATLPSQDFSSEVKNAADAAYNTQAAYLQPQQAEQREATTQQLADQGISPGTDAYDRAIGDLNRSQTFQNQQAQNAAVTAGNAEQQALYGEQLSGAQLGTSQQEAQTQVQQQARQQAVNEILNQYQVPESVANTIANTGEGALGNIVSQLTGLGGLANYQATGTLPTMGGSPTTVQPPNVGSLANAANQGAYNSFVAGNTINSQLGNALGSLGGSNLLFGSGGLSGALGLGSNGLLGSLFGGGAAAAAADTAPLLTPGVGGAFSILPFTA